MGLERELAYFFKEKPALLKVYADKFVLIKDEQLIGAFDTAAAAYSAGVAKFGLNPFLVKRVAEQEETYRNFALQVGLMHAHL